MRLFRTPKHIRDLMVGLLDPKPGQLIGDPACGTAGFLISAAEWIRTHHGDAMSAEDWNLFEGAQFTGFDTDQTMVRISAMNLLLHGVENPDVRNQDSLSRSLTTFEPTISLWVLFSGLWVETSTIVPSA